MTAARLTVPSPLERIMIDRGRFAVPINHVNPLHTNA